MYCKYCKKNKKTSEFEMANVINGKKYLRKKCKVCKNKTQEERRQRNLAFIYDYKSNKSCFDCGNSDFRVLDFHHVGKKDFEIGTSSGLSLERIKKEISKCVVLCSNCHRIRHYKENKK